MNRIIIAMVTLTAALGAALAHPIAGCAYDLEACIPDEATLQEIEAALEQTANSKSEESIVAIDPKAEEAIHTALDHPIGGYDLTTACSFYQFDCATLAKTGSIPSSLYEGMYYVVSFENDAYTGEVFLMRDEEGTVVFSDAEYLKERTTPYSENFDLAQIRALLDTMPDVTNVLFLNDNWYRMNLVSFESEGESYVIPYYYTSFWEEYDRTFPQNTIHPLREYCEWIRSGMEAADPDQVGGALPVREDAAADQTADAGQGTPSGLLLCAGGAVLLALAVIWCVKRVRRT